MSPSVRHAAIAAALPLLLVAGVARAAETIRFAIPAGLSYRFEQSSTMDLDVTVDMDGRRMSDRQRIVQTLRGTASILASEDGRPTRARIAFDRASGGSTTMMNQEMPQPFALAGRTVELTLDGTRVLALEPPAGDPPLPAIDLATRRTIADVVAADVAMLPDGPVAVGDTWTARPRRAGDQVHPTLTFRVERFADRDGRRVAELSVEGRLASATDETEIEGGLAGPSVVDLATGLTLESRLSGELVTAAETNQGGVTMRMNGRGTLEQTARVTLGAVAATDGPAPAGGGDAPSRAPGPAAAGDATLDGTWTGDGLEMRVEGDAVRLTMGELVVAGELEARADGRFTGRFTHRGATFPFAGTWTGDEATFTTGGRTYRLRRPAANPLGGPAGGPANPLGGGGGGAADAAGGGADEAGPGSPDGAPDLSDPDAVARATEGWTRHLHASGASFHHPADWRVQAMPGGLVLAPPDLQAAEESIIAVGTPAEGETDPAGPRAVQAMDAVVAQSMPMLRRAEAPRSVPTPDERPGAAYEYLGRAPDGRRLRCTMLVRIVNDVALGFAVIGLESRVADRLPTVRLMFATLAHEGDAAPAPGPGGDAGAGAEGAAPPGDARLVGAFRGESIRAPGPGGVSVSTQLIWAFNADGTVLHGARSAMSASRRDAGGNLVWTFDGESGAAMRRGRWSTSGDVLTVRWSDGGVSRFRYGFEPDGSLVHRNVRTGRLINFYPRVR